MSEPLSPALRAVSDAVLAVATQLSVDKVLQQLVESARDWRARATPRSGSRTASAASGGSSCGMIDELIAAMGPLPRTHGMLGAMLEARRPYRTDDIHQDARFRGWWPRQHPDMRSFLGFRSWPGAR